VLLGRVVRLQGALVFDEEHAAVVQFADEIRVELVAGRLKAKGIYLPHCVEFWNVVTLHGRHLRA
jgi:hypothetical protein